MTRQRTRRLLAALAAAVVLLAAAGTWHAATPPRTVGLHERAVAVERTLRCPTCQGLSIADSPSPIAAGMRQQVQRQLAAGASPAQIRGYFTARYSDWILLDPPRRGVGWLVWALPPLLLLLGALLLGRTLRRRPSGTANAPEDVAAAAAFAADPPIDAELSDPVAAALTDLAAAGIDADLAPAGQGGVDAALARLAAALYDHPLTAAPTQPAAPDAGENAAVDDAQRLGSAPRRARGRAARYALPVAALLFAGLLAATLARSIGTRPAGTVPTGNFATAPTAPPTPSGPGLAALQHGTHAHPNDPQAWLAYATALDQAGRLAAAEPTYRKTLALDPGDAAAREQLAWLLTRGGSPTDALTVLAPLTRQRPDDPQVVLLLGLAQRGAGQPQATATLRRYLRLAPGSTSAPMVRALLGRAP